MVRALALQGSRPSVRPIGRVFWAQIGINRACTQVAAQARGEAFAGVVHRIDASRRFRPRRRGRDRRVCQTTVGIDSRRVHVSGFSTGAYFASVLLCSLLVRGKRRTSSSAGSYRPAPDCPRPSACRSYSTRSPRRSRRRLTRAQCRSTSRQPPAKTDAQSGQNGEPRARARCPTRRIAQPLSIAETRSTERA